VTATVTDVTNLLRAVLWPLVVVVALFLFRRELPKLVSSVAGRVSKVNLAAISLELVTATAVAPDLLRSLDGIRDPVAVILPSSGPNVLAAAAGNLGRADYAVMDLGDGSRWLTSRLFIFAYVFSEVMGVQRLVFVERRGVASRNFVGTIDPRHLQSRLSRRFPWFSEAILAATAQTSPDQAVLTAALTGYCAAHPTTAGLWEPTVIQSLSSVVEALSRVARSLDPQRVAAITSIYLGHSLIRGPSTFPATPPGGWVELGPPDIRYTEHSEWVRDGEHLNALLDGHLDRDHVIGGPEVSSDDLRRKTLRVDADFVSVVTPEGRFDHLIDRRALLQRLATSVAGDPAPR
jgi:hypothetical protein